MIKLKDKIFDGFAAILLGIFPIVAWVRVYYVLQHPVTISDAGVGSASNVTLGVHVEPYTSVTMAVVVTVAVFILVVRIVRENKKGQKKNATN